MDRCDQTDSAGPFAKCDINSVVPLRGINEIIMGRSRGLAAVVSSTLFSVFLFFAFIFVHFWLDCFLNTRIEIWLCRLLKSVLPVLISTCGASKGHVR